MAINELLFDWKFWSLIVSVLALILSQLPPLHILLRRAKLELEVHSRIYVNHKVGNPTIQSHLIVRNFGGRKVRIKQISMKIARDGREVLNMPAQFYIANPKDNMWVLLTSFDIEPDEKWTHNVQFFNYLDRANEKKYREAEIKLKNEIYEIKKINGQDFFAEAQISTIAPFNDLFEKYFDWQAGEYSAEISILTDSKKTDVTNHYRFTIFESQTESLQEHKKGFPSGATIYWESPNYLGQWIEVEQKSAGSI